jgi:putative tryptophan/tyrosine transport system substrate-binding protein
MADRQGIFPVSRRAFITLVGGAAAWPLTARAQQPAVSVIGFLHPGSPEANASNAQAFRKGLSELGYVEGQNLTIEYRWAMGQDARLPELAADLVRRRVAVLATPGTMTASLAAQAATKAIPIVFGTSSDPVEFGLVASLNRPGGNITGISNMNTDLGPKRIGLMHELLPNAMRFGALVNPHDPERWTEIMVRDAQAAAAAIGRQFEPVYAGAPRDLEAAFRSIVQKQIDAVLVVPDPLFFDRRIQIITLAARHGVLAIYPARDWAEACGLISYGASLTDQFRQAGLYTGLVLKGEKPADLPILRATKFQLVINLQTARAFDIEIPPTLLAIADEVIE